MKRYLIPLLAFAILTLPCAAWGKSIYPGHVRVGGSALSTDDELTLGKFDLLLMNKNHNDSLGGSAFDQIKAVSTGYGRDVKIVVYYNLLNTSDSQDCVNAKANNTMARWTGTACGHSLGNISIDNSGYLLLDSDGNNILSQSYGSHWLDIGLAGVKTYVQEVITTDLVGKAYSGDGHFHDNFISIFYKGGINPYILLDDVPAKYPTNSQWTTAITGFASALGETHRANNMISVFNYGNSIYVDGAAAWPVMDAVDYPPTYTMEEGGLVQRYGATLPNTHMQFLAWPTWKRQLDALDSMQNSYVFMLCGTLLSDQDSSGVDNYGQTATFWEALYMALGGYYLFKKPGDIFSWTYGSNPYNTKGMWFDEYDAANGGNLDFGSADSGYQAVQVSNGTRIVTIYKREFENGYVFVNPMSSNTAGYYALTDIDINAAPPTGLGLSDASVKSITHANVLTALGSISDVTTISIDMNRAVFLRKPAAAPPDPEGNVWNDPNLVSLWRMESGGLTTDSAGTNTLTDNGTVGTDAVNFKDGAASATFDGSTEYLSIADASLDAGHPFKDGVTPSGFSIFGFIKPTTATGAIQYLASKWATGDINVAILLNIYGRVTVWNSDGNFVYNSRSLSDGQWAFVCYTYDVSTKAYQIYVYDYSNSTGYQKSGTQSDITAYNTNSAAFVLGAKSDASSKFTGNMDMWGVMKDVLTFEEMEAIRLGTYAGSFPSDWPAYATITIQGSKIAGTGSQGNIPVYLNQTNFPAAMFDAGGTNYLQTDGDDLRFTDCLDDPANCILPHELVSIAGVDETDDNEAIEVHVLVPLVGATDKPIYAWYGNPDADAPTAASQQSVWADYKAVYHFGSLSDSTGNFNLSVGAGVEAEIIQYTTQTPPVGAYWAEIDGGDYLYSNTMDVAGGASANLSVEFWWKGDNHTGEHWAMGQWDYDVDPTPARAWGISKTSTTGYPQYRIGNDGTNYHYSQADTSLGTTDPVHITTVYNDALASDNILIYQNGVLDDAAPEDHTTGIYESGYLPFMIGGVWNDSAVYGPMNGKLDEIRIMEGVISADRALTTYRNQSDPATFAIEDADAEVGPAILAMGVIYDGTFYDVDVNPLTHEFANDDEIIIAWKLNSEAVIQAPHTITVDLTLVGRGITSVTNGTFALELLGSDYYLTNRYTVQDGDQVADLAISAAITVGTGGSITDLDARAFDLDYTAFGTDLGSVSIVAPYPSDNPVLIGTDYNTVTAWKTAVTTAMVGSNLTVAATTEPGALDMSGDDCTELAPCRATLSGTWTQAGAGLTTGDWWEFYCEGNSIVGPVVFGANNVFNRCRLNE